MLWEKPIAILVKKVKILILAIVIGGQLNAQDKYEYKQVGKYFSENQITVLKSIISFVDSIVTENNSDKKAAYLQFFNSLDSAYTFYHPYSKIADSSFVFSLNQDCKKRFLGSLSTDVFNKIWTVQMPRLVKTIDTTIYYPENFLTIDLNNKGDYVKLLNSLGRKNKYYKVISNEIEVCGGICPTIVAGMFTKINDFDFANFTDRLWIAIFLITLEDPIQMRVSRYLAK